MARVAPSRDPDPIGLVSTLCFRVNAIAPPGAEQNDRCGRQEAARAAGPDALATLLCEDSRASLKVAWAIEVERPHYTTARLRRTRCRHKSTGTRLGAGAIRSPPHPGPPIQVACPEAPPSAGDAPHVRADTPSAERSLVIRRGGPARVRTRSALLRPRGRLDGRVQRACSGQDPSGRTDGRGRPSIPPGWIEPDGTVLHRTKPHSSGISKPSSPARPARSSR
jgi:hypothetical protein